MSSQNDRLNIEIFKSFAEYYDLIYRDKNYHTDTNFLIELLETHGRDVSTVLDLGCGTGGHVLLLSELGFLVTGLDRSEAMLQIAKSKAQKLKFHHPPSFEIGDMRFFNLKQKFDCIISLFSSINYLLQEADLISLFKSVRQHLNKGGVFILDSWNAECVKKNNLIPRTKIIELENATLTRTSSIVHHRQERSVNIHYRLEIANKSNNSCRNFYEDHAVRYFESDELLHSAEQCGLACVESGPWGSRQTATDMDWNRYWILEAR